MKRSRCIRPIASVALFAGVLFLSTIAWAQEPPDPPRLQVQVVTLQLQIGDQEPFRLSVGMGQAGTLESPELGGTWLIVPVAADPMTDEVTLQVSKAVGTRANGLLVAETSAVSLYRDFRQPLAHLPVDVRVLDVRRVGVRAPSQGIGLAGAYREGGTFLPNSVTFTPQSDCCVSCGRTTICGCDVQLSCGSCCTWCCSDSWTK